PMRHVLHARGSELQRRSFPSLQLMYRCGPGGLPARHRRRGTLPGSRLVPEGTWRAVAPRLGSRHPPDLCRTVERARQNKAPIRTELSVVDLLDVSGDGQKEGTRCDIPKPCRLVVRCGQLVAYIWAE